MPRPKINGSSPRGRGTRSWATGSKASGWFIPAWAGNAIPPSRAPGGGPVHPRVGGERPEELASAKKAIGSSPRGRGTRGRSNRRGGIWRFIPAWAGNARWPRTRRRPMPVHPRVGGERSLDGGKQGADDGSSPRGRGTHSVGGAAQSVGRFIPAWAGNARQSSPRPSAEAVHPRVGGERARTATPCDGGRGSSPRGRGTRWREDEQQSVKRFIPAWAGNAMA